jgi:transcriptional regulator with XRE-family HTH domain
VKSDERAPAAAPPAQGDDAGAAGQSVGQYLANQRRLRRISLEELAERTRIPRRNLERLESGALDAAADGFTRGFVRTVAEALGLDANEAVMRLVGEPGADEERAQAAARRGALLRLGAAALLLAAALGAGAWLLLRREPEAEAAASPSVTFRRDVVRGLAEGEGAPAPTPAPAAEEPR